MRILKAVLPLLAMLLALSLSASAASESAFATAASNLEDRMRESIQRGEIRDAIIAAAEYENVLIESYPPPSFQMNLFRSQAQHLSFHNSFTDWKQVEVTELGLPEWLPMMGFRLHLALDGETEDDRFLLFSTNLGDVEERTGVAPLQQPQLTDQELLTSGLLIAGNVGVVKSQEFKRIASHRVLLLTLATPMGGPVTVASLGRGRQLYAFMLFSSLGNHDVNEKKLVELLVSVDFTYRPPDEARIDSVCRSGRKEKVEDLLKCSRRLANIGEYSAAAGEVAKVRAILGKRMPKAYIKENVAHCPSYGVSLANPDEKKWELTVEDAVGTKMLMLEDKWSVKEEGIVIVITDTVLAYGRQAAAVLQDEEEKKQFLIAHGRGGAMSIGTIENERFTVVKGELAYEAIVGTNMPGGIRVKARSLLRPELIIGIIIMADAKTFEEKIQVYDSIIEGDWLRIAD